MPKTRSIVVDTTYGRITNVPAIEWQAILPYWELIVKSIAEVVTENKFLPYPASYSRPGGIVASAQYWESYKRFNDVSIVYEAKRFIDLLKTKKDFYNSIRFFNRGSKVDWLNDDNIHLLGGRLYGFYYTLKPIFIEVKEGDDIWLRVRMKT
ncbi:MAG: hypothetical protein QXJ74_10690 [Nitrososphaera sp.]